MSHTREPASGTIRLRRCSPSDLQLLLGAQSVVLDALPDPELLEPSSSEELAGYLSGNGEIVGAFRGGSLVGYGILTPLVVSDPRLRELGEEIARYFDVESRVLGVLDTVAVLPEHRGNGLQRVICDEIRTRAESQGLSLLMTTVSPRNHVSIRNFALLGYSNFGTRLLYGEKERAVLALAW